MGNPLIPGIALDSDGRETGSHTLDEVSAIPFRLKTEKIVGQKRMDDLASPWEPHEEIPWRKGNVQEKSLLYPDPGFFQISAHQQEVVVMDPYQIIGVGL